MKKIVLIIDGAVGQDYQGLEFTSLVDRTEHFSHTPKGFTADSLNCICTILGVPSKKIPRGRAYLEAVASGIEVGENDLVLRANWVNTKDGLLTSSCANLNEDKLSNVIESLSATGFELYPLGEYKNIIVLRNKKDLLENIITYAPHENLSCKVDLMLPSCEDRRIEKVMRNLIYEDNLWVWGEAVKTTLPSYEKLHNKKGAFVCKTQIVVGIAMAMKMYCPSLKYATADIDTDLTEKRETALVLIDQYDEVYIHINGADEAGHRRNKKEKLDFIKKIEKEVILPIIHKKERDVQFIITSDHATLTESGAHSDEAVPSYFVG